MKHHRIAAALFCATALGAAAADLIGVFRDAQTSDPVYQSARAQYQATLEKVPQARAGYLPLVAFTASGFRNDINFEHGVPPVSGAPGVSNALAYNTNAYLLTLSQPIFRAQNWIAIDQAKLQVMQAEAILAAAGQDLALRASQAYFDVLLAQDNVALSESQKVAISEQLAQAKRNFEVGTATIVDTLEAQARYDQANAKEISDKNDLEVKRRALQLLVGKVPEFLLPLKDPLVLAPPVPADIEAWVSTGHESSYNVVSAKANAEIARREIDRQRAGHLPTVDLSATYGEGYNPTTSTASVLGSNTITGTVGLTLSVPIFAGGLTQSRVREAIANRDRAEQDLENTERTVAQSVRTNFLNVTSGIAQVRALEQALTSTQSQLDSTILGRDVGVRTSVDVLNAQQQVYQTRRDLQQARYNYLLSTLRLKAAAGTLTDTDIELVNRTLGRS